MTSMDSTLLLASEIAGSPGAESPPWPEIVREWDTRYKRVQIQGHGDHCLTHLALTRRTWRRPCGHGRRAGPGTWSSRGWRSRGSPDPSCRRTPAQGPQAACYKNRFNVHVYILHPHSHLASMTSSMRLPEEDLTMSGACRGTLMMTPLPVPSHSRLQETCSAVMRTKEKPSLPVPAMGRTILDSEGL